MFTNLNGMLARAVNKATNSTSYILIRTGSLTYDDRSQSPCIQIFRAIPDHAGNWQIWDVLNDENVDEVAAELEQGTYRWYDEQLELTRLEGDEETFFRREIGWTDMA
ncbi:hypothetical protein ABT340_36735 [Streptosporangium sp. NPDC000239]|uniref:hypothetical protein n=1 Tax=Streptosporangium sp. NPDC000239 TaxID=3154248 RepID=UPI00331B4130